MRLRVLGFVMCATLVAMAVFSGPSDAKEQEKNVIATAIQGGADLQHKPQLAPQSNVVSSLEIERVKKEEALASELKTLKEKNLLVAEFQGTLISIVIWSLGVAVSIVLVLVTASFFTSFKVHERDIQRIQDDYAAKLAVLNSDIDSKFSKVSSEIEARHEARSQQDLDRMLSQATEIRSQFEQFRVSLEEKLAEGVKSAARAEAKADKLQEDQLGFASDVSRLEIRVWELKKVPGNVLIASVEGLNAALKKGDKWSVDNFIKIIKEVMEEHYVTTRLPLSAFVVEFLSNAMTKLSKSRPEQAEEILSMLKVCVHEKKDVG
ncbi:hypothetical protein [Pseudomonas sp. NFACC37-1]|uniref:hypothetical protein n=1 Tax=Pseudomonas sp. NFACC37-1 TaxID=1566196 RepID=UPI000890C764|nr:hypothetical protein [Pseudomonas sp. NFACC37-1]SCZ01417.1 hypothetical protein SAMN03159391_04523 [Pseudomonas sp. NFACC37-1]